MLRTLSMQNFVLVEAAEIHFGTGFTVLSGETGAGKSMLIDALNLILGERSDLAVVREGAAQAEISARFDLSPPLQTWLTQHHIQTQDALILRRVITSHGRHRAWINGQPISITRLRELGNRLVDIHGHHAHQSLLAPDNQRDLLDAYGVDVALGQRVDQAWHRWRQLAQHIKVAERNEAAHTAKREHLQWQIDELERLNLGPHEWETLQTAHTRLAHTQALIDGIDQLLRTLESDEAAAHHRLTRATHLLERLKRYDPSLQVVHDTLDSAQIAVVEAVSDLNHYISRLELDPGKLAQTEERLQTIFELARKFNTQPAALPALQTSLQGQLAELTAITDVPALKIQMAAAQADYTQAAHQLSAARGKAAQDLASRVTGAMQTLAMPGGRLEIVLNPSAPSAHGNETIEFLIAGHAGAVLRPLHKVASGGELSRIALALCVITSRAAHVPTLIFDEVDSGVGGAVAEVIGQLLEELGQHHQVLCITHLPQVAARAATHYQVSKAQKDDSMQSCIVKLDATARIEEIARMLGGITITATARRHAQEMLGT